MQEIKPLNFLGSLLFFGGAALLFRLSVYGLMPALLTLGSTPFWAFITSYTIPLAILIFATFIGLAREGNLSHWRPRLRLTRLTPKQALACGGIFALGFLLTGLLLPSAKLLAAVGFLKPPAFLPAILNPNHSVPGGTLTDFMGVPLQGAYWVVAVYFVFRSCVERVE